MTEPLRAEQTALLFPTGGYHFAGMGADVDLTPHRALFDRTEATLAQLGVPADALRTLMAGEGQARRNRTERGWEWVGDFPLSMVAQMALGVVLARAFALAHGAPRVLVGESMGELAAYCAAGALCLEDATRLTWRWAKDLQAASDRLGLRMAVVEDLEEDELALFAPELQASVVVAEASCLFVVALPAKNLDALEEAVRTRGGHILVSNNPCVAHELRLGRDEPLWREHQRFLAGMVFTPPSLPILSTLTPGRPLDDEAALRLNRVDTTFQRVRWDQTVAGLPALGVRDLVLFGPPSSLYALKKLRSQDERLKGVRLHAVASLAAVAALPNRLPVAPAQSEAR